MKFAHDLKKIFNKDARAIVTFIALVLVAVLVILVAIYFAEYRKAIDNRTEIERISESPSGYTTLDGKSFVFDTTKHKLTVVTTWATWCSLCLPNLNALSTISDEMGDDVAFIAVNRKEQKNIVDSYLREVTLPDGLTYVLDPEDFLLKATNGFAVPETVLINSSGREVGRLREPLTEESARAFINSQRQ